MKNLIPLMLALTFLAACSPSGDFGGPTGSSPENEVKKTVTIQGMTPAEYYNQFLYEDSYDCGNKQMYRLLGNWNISLNKQVNDHEVQGSLRVFLYPDGTFAAEYDEDELGEPGTIGRKITPVTRETVNDRWSITEDGEIILGVLGRGTSLMYNNGPGINFKFGSFFADKTIRYSDIVLFRISSTHGKRNNPRCPNAFKNI